MKRIVKIPFGSLNIEAKSNLTVLDNVIKNNEYRKNISEINYNIILGYKIKLPSQCYRSRMLGKGIFLGHHIGKPAILKLKPFEMQIYISDGKIQDYEKIFWNYALKYILSFCSIVNDVLHVKGVLLSKKDKTILIMGRGSSGKTTLAKFLKILGYKLISNTHVIVKKNYTWGMNTWIRDRTIRGSEYTISDDKYIRDFKLNAVYIYNYNTMDIIRKIELDNELARSYLIYFGSAIGTYDLKEDIWDSFETKSKVENSPFRIFSKEVSLINKFVTSNQVYYLTADLLNHKKTLNNKRERLNEII